MGGLSHYRLPLTLPRRFLLLIGQLHLCFLPKETQQLNSHCAFMFPPNVWCVCTGELLQIDLTDKVKSV